MIKNILAIMQQYSDAISAITAIASLLISTISIILAVRTAILPYKRKIRLSCYWTIDVQTAETKGFQVIATNIGNRTLYITSVGLGIRKDCDWKKIRPKYSEKDVNGQKIGQGELVVTEYPLEALSDEAFRSFELSKCLYLFAQDSEGHTYKKKYGTIKKLQNNILERIKEDKTRINR